MAMELEIVIPENWYEVTLPQYLSFKKSIKPYEGQDIYADKIIEHACYRLCGIKKDILHKLPTDAFLTVQESVLKLIASNNNEKLVKSFEIGDTTYGFIPDFNAMTYGEYVDLVELCKNTWDNIAEIMAILYRPIVKKYKDSYEIAKYNGSNENQIYLFQQKLTMDIVYGALSFFLYLQTDLARGTLTYSMETLTSLTPTQKRQINQLLIENGLSTQQFQSLLTTTLQSLTPLPE